MRKFIYAAFLFVFLKEQVFAQKKNDRQQEIVIVSGNPTLSADDSVKINQFYYEGIKEKVINNHQLATDYFLQILKLDPSNHFAAYEVAQIFFKTGNLARAKEYAQIAVTINPNNNWYWLLMANIYQEQQDIPLLIYALDELIKLEPTNYDYLFNKADALIAVNKDKDALEVYKVAENKLGLIDKILLGKQKIYIKNGDLIQAINDLNTLIQHHPSEYKYYIYLGDLYFKNKKGEDAIKSYQKAKELSGSNPYIDLAVAQIYESQQNKNEAFEAYQSAFQQVELGIDQKVKIILKYFESFPDEQAILSAEKLAKILTLVHPDDAKSFSVYGDVLYQKGDLLAAEPIYQQALIINKNVFAIWDQLCRIQYSLNKPNELIATGEEALTLFPNQVQIYYYTALGYLQLKKFNNAISYFNNALAFDLEDKKVLSDIYSGLGDAYYGLKNYKESFTALENAIRHHPDNSYTLNNYAYYLTLRNEELDKAMEMSAKSNRLSPNNSAFQDTYAWVLFKLEKFQEAKVWIEKAITNNSKSATQYHHYGDILFKLGDKESALNNWKKALQLDKNNVVLQRKVNEKKLVE